MFEHFSFSSAPTQHVLYPSFLMEDNISPTSSRESTPCYDRTYTTYIPPPTPFPTSTSIAELSLELDKYSLSPRRKSSCIDAPPPHRVHVIDQTPRSVGPQGRQVSHRRQSLVRRQCSSAHLTRVASLVDDMLQQHGSPVYTSSQKTLGTADETSSPSPSPEETCSPHYFNVTSAPSSLLDIVQAETLHHPSRTNAYKIDKELRHCGSRDTLRAQEKVLKPIRLRRRPTQASMSMPRERK